MAVNLATDSPGVVYLDVYLAKADLILWSEFLLQCMISGVLHEIFILYFPFYIYHLPIDNNQSSVEISFVSWNFTL